MCIISSLERLQWTMQRQTGIISSGRISSRMKNEISNEDW